jgi:hypothetical protein
MAMLMIGQVIISSMLLQEQLMAIGSRKPSALMENIAMFMSITTEHPILIQPNGLSNTRLIQDLVEPS